MARKRKQLTVEQHEELAERLNRAASELHQVLSVVYEAYGVSNQAAKTLEKLVFTGGKLDLVRSYLDACYCGEHDGDSPYYGNQQVIDNT